MSQSKRSPDSVQKQEKSWVSPQIVRSEQLAKGAIFFVKGLLSDRMSEHIGEEMEAYEIEQFLKERGLGILGFAQNGEAYTIPIAFAYDETEPRCILRFIMGEDSKKQAFVSSTESASLSTYEWDGKDNWKSVVVNGPIRKLANEEMAQAAAIFSNVGEEAALEVFNRPVTEYETEWYELQATEVTGRGRFG